MAVYQIILRGAKTMITLRDKDNVMFDIDINDIEEVQTQEEKTFLLTTTGTRIQLGMHYTSVLNLIMRARLGV